MGNDKMTAQNEIKHVSSGFLFYIRSSIAPATKNQSRSIQSTAHATQAPGATSKNECSLTK